MKNYKPLFFLIISLSTQIYTMDIVPTLSSMQPTSIAQLLAVLSSADTIETKKAEILAKTKALRDPISEENVDEIATLWNNLTMLHVSNGLERLFNWRGPKLDNLLPLKRQLSLLCHPDKYPNNAQRLEIFKSLELTPRENPLIKEFDAETITNIGDRIAAKIDSHGNQIKRFLQQSMFNNTVTVELNNAQTMMECYSYIEQNKVLQNLYQTKKGN